MTNVERFNNQTAGEEIANAVTHGLGALLALAGTVILLVNAYFYGDTIDIVSSAIYGGGLFILYAMSASYHSVTNYKAKRVLQVFDHCSIFLLILGSYAPLCLSLLGGSLGWTIFSINLACGVLGLTVNIIDVRKFHKLSLVMYLVMGWSILFAVKPIFLQVGVSGFLLLLGGGLAYSIGVLFYKSEAKYMHPIWHLFVLAGSGLHYFFILFYVIL